MNNCYGNKIEINAVSHDPTFHRQEDVLGLEVGVDGILPSQVSQRLDHLETHSSQVVDRLVDHRRLGAEQRNRGQRSNGGSEGPWVNSRQPDIVIAYPKIVTDIKKPSYL